MSEVICCGGAEVGRLARVVLSRHKKGLKSENDNRLIPALVKSRKQWPNRLVAYAYVLQLIRGIELPILIAPSEYCVQNSTKTIALGCVKLSLGIAENHATKEQPF